MRPKIQFLVSLLFFLCFFCTLLIAQPAIEWDKTIGTTDNEFPIYTITPTTDGGYIMAASANIGISGDKSELSRGYYDYWIVKLDKNGQKEWDKTLGGNGLDNLRAILNTNDGGYLLGGHSLSGISGEKTADNNGDPDDTGDFWIVKLDKNGQKEWDKTIGGLYNDGLTCMDKTADGGYILVGFSDSDISFDKTSASKGIDYWIVKITANGTIQWDKTIGSTNTDWLFSIKQTADKGYILGGNSETRSEPSGDRTSPGNGDFDYWAVKLDSVGNQEWDRALGGESAEYIGSIEQTVDGGYILGGYSESGIDGDKTSDRDSYDYWIVKLSATGTKEWDKALGGNGGLTFCYSAEQTNDGGYIAAGASSATVGADKSEDYGYDVSTMWLVKLAPDGTKLWDKTLGDGLATEGRVLAHTPDGGLVVVGLSNGGGEDQTELSKGGNDYWIVKFAPENPLPVTLDYFTAQKENSTAQLTWKTTSETRSDHFEVEHSKNGKSWKRIATLNAQGESDAPYTYQFVNVNTVNGDNYYRLKMVDNDGTFTYSKIEHLNFELEIGLTAYPNPAAEFIHLQVDNWLKVVKVQILDTQGKVVYESGNKPVKNLGVAAFQPGLYLVKVALIDGTEATRKIAIGE